MENNTHKTLNKSEDNLKNEDDLKNYDDLKTEDNLKNEDDHKDEDNLKNKDDLPLPLKITWIFFDELSPWQSKSDLKQLR